MKCLSTPLSRAQDFLSSSSHNKLLGIIKKDFSNNTKRVTGVEMGIETGKEESGRLLLELLKILLETKGSVSVSQSLKFEFNLFLIREIWVGKGKEKNV